MMIKRCGWKNRVRIGLMLTIAAGAVALPAQAGIGPDFQQTPPYVLSIIDDPDPTGLPRSSTARVPQGQIVLEHYDREVDGAPSIMIHPFNRMPMATWARRGKSDHDVVISRYVDGRWTVPLALADSPANEVDPRLAVNPSDGSVHVVYWIRDAEPAVIHRQAPASLAGWSEPRFVSAPGEIAARPSATFHDGHLRIVFESHGNTLESTPRLIVLATELPTGFSTERVGLSYHTGPNWPFVVDRAGVLAVEWIDGAGQVVDKQQRENGWWVANPSYGPVRRSSPAGIGPGRGSSRRRPR